MISACERSASSTIACAGVARADQPGLDLKPALRPASFALSSSASPAAPPPAGRRRATAGSERAGRTPPRPAHPHRRAGRRAQRRGVEIGPEDRHHRRAVIELDEERGPLAARDLVVPGQVHTLSSPVDDVAREPDDHPPRADVARVDVQNHHRDPRGERPEAPDDRAQRNPGTAERDARRGSGTAARGRAA